MNPRKKDKGNETYRIFKEQHNNVNIFTFSCQEEKERLSLQSLQSEQQG